MYRHPIFLICLFIFLAIQTICFFSIDQAQASAVIHARGDDNYPPYEYVDEGQPTGFNVEIFRAVADTMGLQATVELGPWNEVRSELEEGEIDLVTGMYFSEERAKNVDFSTPHIQVFHTIFIRNDSNITSLKDVEEKEIIVQRGDIMHDFVLQKNLSNKIITVENQIDALRLLASGKYDCAILAKLQGLYLVHTYKLKNVHTVGEPIEPRQYCFAVTKGNHALLDKLNEGLRIIHATGQYNTIRKKWFGTYERAVTKLDVLKKAAWILALLAFLLFAALLWSWSLKRKVKQRTQALKEELNQRLRIQKELREKQNLIQTIFNSTPDFLILKDTQKKILFANLAFCQFVGQPTENIINVSYSDLFPKEEAEKFETEDEYVLSSKKQLAKDSQATGKQGQRWFHVVKTPILDEQDNATGVLVSVRDITHRRLMEVALRESSNWLSTTLNSVGDAVITTNMKNYITYMNPEAQKLTGFSVQKANRMPLDKVFRLIDEESNKKLENLASIIMREKPTAPISRNAILISRNGEKRHISDSGAPIIDDNGNILGVVLVFRDISQQRDLDAQLRHQQKLESIGTLAGGVAHEINNPINIIMNYGQLLVDNSKLDDSTREDARTIVDESYRIANIVKNLLAFSRREKEPRNSVSLNSIFESTFSLIDRILKKDQIQIDTHIDPNLPPVICRKQQIMQVLMNLITNARDVVNTRYPDYDENKQISIFSQLVQNDHFHYVRTSVRDTGTGIPNAIKDRIFDPFFTSKPRHQGTGLGLSVSYGIIKEHGGQMGFETEENVGTTFYFDLPVATETSGYPPSNIDRE